MPMNDNPRAIKIVNEHMRPNADRMVGIIMEAQGLAVLATEQGTSSVFPQTSDPIADGAAEDGRNTVTNADALTVPQAHREFLEWANTASKVTGKTPLQAFAKFAVNPTMR